MAERVAAGLQSSSCRLGPVLFCALARLAAICRSLAITRRLGALFTIKGETAARWRAFFNIMAESEIIAVSSDAVKRHVAADLRVDWANNLGSTRLPASSTRLAI
jgi:hypothetical protein